MPPGHRHLSRRQAGVLEAEVTSAEPVPTRPRDIPVLGVDVYGAMRMLRFGRTTVLGLAGAGQLPQLRADRTLRFALADAERLIEPITAGASDDGAKSG
jgi:hypothetical protein